MADTAVAEEIRKRRTADALNGQDDDSEEEDTLPGEQSTEADTAALAEEEAVDQGATDQEEIPSAPAEKAPSLGYRFVPVTPPATTGAAPESPSQALADEFAAKGADPDPDNPDYKTPLTPGEETQFQKWVKGNNIPFDDSASSDYDMRGYWKAQQAGDPNAVRSAKNLHFPDTYKTPFHKTFSNESQYATQDAPHWEEDRLIDKNGNIVADETAKPAGEGKPSVFSPDTAQYVGVEAPSKLTQVERGELVKPPAEAPGQLTQVERGELVKPSPEAPGTLPQVERGELVKVPPGTAPRATAIPTAPAVRPAVPVTPFMGEEGLDVTPTPPKVQRALGYKFVPVAPAVKPAEAIPAPPKVQPAQPITTNPNGSDFPQRVQAVGNNDPAAFIVHHTSGRGTVDGVVSTLKERGLGVQYVMDRDGNIFQTGGPGAQNILKGWGKGEGLSNQNIVGMEIIAKDDKDVTPAQAQAFARFIAARYPNTPLYGHGEVNPGHKEADEGQSAKAAALAYRDQLSSGQVAQTSAAPQAQPVTKQANGLYQNEKPEQFLSGKATTFATPEDIASGADNGRGAKHLGELDTTSVAAVAIPEAALRAKYGNNYAAWRRARVDVVDPQTGKRLRLPIGDLGPRGDLSAIVDMTPWVSNYFGGDKNLMVKLVDNAGPDVTKNPQLFADEQAAIRQGFDSSTLQAGVQKIAPKLGYNFKPVDQARNTALQQGFEQASKAAIAQLPEQNQSLPALINRLNQPIKGVPDAMRQNYQKAIQDEATKYAQDYYGIKDPKEAYAKIMSSPDIGTFLGEIKDKVLPYLNQAVTAFNQSAVTIDQNRLDMLAKAIHPNASPEARKTFINSITSEPDDVKRTIMINSLIGNLANENPNNPALAALNPGDIADSASRMANPEYQKRQQQEIARQVEANTKALRPDPRLQGTAAGWWADQFAQLPKNVIEGITGPLGQSLMLSEIYQGTVERLRKDNPGMSEDELKARAAGSTMAQIVPAEVLNRLAGGKLGGLTGAIENPVKRIGLSALAHLGIGGAAGAAQQVGINVAEGKPTAEGVLQAAGAGAVQALPGVVGGVVHGRTPVAEERPPVTEERPPVTEPVRPPVEPVRPAEEAAPAPVEGGTTFTTSKGSTYVLHDDGTTTRNKAYHPEHGVADQGLQPRSEQTFFVTPEDAQKLGEIQTRGGPKTVIAPLSGGRFGLKYVEGPDAGKFERRTVVNGRTAPEVGLIPVEMWEGGGKVHFGNEITDVTRPPAIPVTQEDVARRAYEIYDERTKNGQPGTALDDWTQAQRELSQATEPTLPGTMSEAEPITSAIANRYVQERMAAGELGQIDPSQGQSTEDMVNQGLKMSPTQRDGLIDNFTKGKGGDLDQQGAAIRSKEALLSEQSRAASRDASANPTNPQLQAQAKAAADAVTAFHNGPIKKFKQVWSNAGRGLQREIPLDYTTFNGMKEAYLKGKNEEAPANLEPKLKKMADAVSKAADAERVVMNNFGKEIGKQTRGKAMPADEQIRSRLMEIMKDLPCPGGAS